MENNSTPSSNCWSSLSTITVFDKGNDEITRVSLNSDVGQSNGQIVNVIAPSTNFLIESLIQHLCTFFEDDTNRRNKLYYAICDRLHELRLMNNSYNMVEFETLRCQYQRALYHLVTVARIATGCESALQVPSSLMTEWCRYDKEFEEISFIASGGYGAVFKALHRLDGIEYAIKKIIVQSRRLKSIMQNLKEVKTFAKLNHANIVSYKGAWIEPTLPSTFVSGLPRTNHSESTMSSIDYRKKKRFKGFISQNYNIQGQSNSNSCWSKQKDDEEVKLQNGANCTSEQQIGEENVTNENIKKINSNSVSFRSDDLNQSDKARSDTNSTYSSDSCEDSYQVKELCPYTPQRNEKYATLYIQMALCEKTLQQWLDERIEATSQAMIIAIVTQILCGLDYIHCREIVHHDVKPSNIFISTSGHLQVQLGDFGLACSRQRKVHHSMFGTHMYAAPEQLEGQCDPKSDIYSLGIVLVEMLVHTKTQMEQIEIINGLKRGQIPTTLTAMYPTWIHVVSQLVQKDPQKRPTTSQLLQNLNEDKDIMIAHLKNDNAEKDNEIKKLQTRISMLEAQITKHNISIEDT